MKFPILTAAVILCLVIAYCNRKSKEQVAAMENEFWDKELQANNTRRKSLDDLDYISVPLESLPINIHLDNDTIKGIIQTIVELSKSPIVNLTGISNTDLKLKYGAPNIDLLAQYDSRYTALVTNLQKWGSRLYELGDIDSTKSVLEFAVSTHTDVSGTYKLLSEIYLSEGDVCSMEKLISYASNINTPMKTTILNSLTDRLNILKSNQSE